MKRLVLISCLLAIGLLSGCNTDTTNKNLGQQNINSQEKDNLGNIGKILRTADHARVLREYESLKNNEHDMEQLERILSDIDALINTKKSNIMIDVRIGDYGDVEVRRLFSATEKNLIGIEASKEEINTVSFTKDKNKAWNKAAAKDNGGISETTDCSEYMGLDHGLYILFAEKLDRIREGKCLGEISGKTYILVDDKYGWQTLYVIGEYKNKKYKNDWDMNIVQFVSSDGSFKDTSREIYNVENTFIYKDGCNEVKEEALRVISMYPKNGLNKNIKKMFK
ncbi:hypothetical protein AALB16_09630 [Lachnospiraceae bacterium 62-35]